MTGYAGYRILEGSAVLAQAQVESQVDERVDLRVEIGDCRGIAEVWPLDAQGIRLAVDALNSGPLFVNVFVDLALAVKGVTDTSARAGGHGTSATLIVSSSL